MIPLSDITVIQYASRADKEAGIVMRIISLQSEITDPSTPTESKTIVREGAALDADAELKSAALLQSTIIERLKTEEDTKEVSPISPVELSER